MTNEKCCFSTNGRCSTKTNVDCCGINDSCGFFKTAEQFIADRDRSIEINRRNGRCDNCKYVPYPCKLSSEDGHRGFGGMI